VAGGNFAKIAAPALNSTLAVGSKAFAGLVLAWMQGHGVSPLDFCGETAQNTIGSEVVAV
jgi:hypothetical protein